MSIRLITAALFFSIGTYSPPAIAQATAEAELAELSFRPTKENANLTACSLEYTLIAEDHLYVQGRMLGIKGALMSMVVDNVQVLMLKAIVVGIIGDNAQPLPVKNLYLESDYGVIRPHKVGDGEPSAKLAVFGGKETDQIYKDLHTLRIGFNLEGGRSDFVLDFNFSRKPEPVLSFLDCSVQIME